MDAENLKKRLQQYTFRENNGRILRTVNIPVSYTHLTLPTNSRV